MKYLKEYKIFENDNFDWMKDLFAYLQDDGLRVRVKENVNCVKLDFTNKSKIDSSEVIFNDVNNTISLTEVHIDKIKQGRQGPSLDYFNIKDVFDTLLQAESYSKEELKLDIECVYVVDIPNYVYYKSISDLPKEQKINSVSLYFANK